MGDNEDDQFSEPEDHPGPDEDGVLPEGEDVPDRDSSWMSLVSWVETLIASVESFDHEGNMHWCPQWWAHPEAVERFRGMHQQYLASAPNKDQPYGLLSSWWTDHFDHHAAVLFAKRGPFGECRDGHVDKPRLPTVPPPADWIA